MVKEGHHTAEEMAEACDQTVETIRVALHRARRAGQVVDDQFSFAGLSPIGLKLTDRGHGRLEHEQTRSSDATIVEAFRGRNMVPDAPVFRCGCSVWLGVFDEGQSCSGCRSSFERVVPIGKP